MVTRLAQKLPGTVHFLTSSLQVLLVLVRNLMSLLICKTEMSKVHYAVFNGKKVNLKKNDSKFEISCNTLISNSSYENLSTANFKIIVSESSSSSHSAIGDLGRIQFWINCVQWGNRCEILAGTNRSIFGLYVWTIYAITHSVRFFPQFVSDHYIYHRLTCRKMNLLSFYISQFSRKNSRWTSELKRRKFKSNLTDASLLAHNHEKRIFIRKCDIAVCSIKRVVFSEMRDEFWRIWPWDEE